MIQAFKGKLQQQEIGEEKIGINEGIVDKYSWKEYIRKYIRKGNEKVGLQSFLIYKQIKFLYSYDYNQTLQALQVHMNNGSPYIQNYLNIMQKKESNTLDLICQTYRFQLYDMLVVLKGRKEKNEQSHKHEIPKEFISLLLKNVFEGYRYILYLLLNKTHRQKKLQYCISPKKIIITQDYRIKLAYPCLQNNVYSKEEEKNTLLLLKPNIISTNLRHNIGYLANRLVKQYSDKDNKSFDLFLKQFDDNSHKNIPEVSILNELQNIRYWISAMKLQQMTINNQQSILFMMEIEKQIKKPFCLWNRERDEKNLSNLSIKSRSQNQENRNRDRNEDHQAQTIST